MPNSSFGRSEKTLGGAAAVSEALRGFGRVGRVWGCQTAVPEGHKNRSAAKAVSWRDQPSEGVSEALRGFGSIWRDQARVSERGVQSQALRRCEVLEGLEGLEGFGGAKQQFRKVIKDCRRRSSSL